MQGWYQFGFDGFPSGEVRRRFYRQRDDPCDSEEEQEVYNDNDRPVYYYPMHESEEASSAEDEMDDELMSIPPPPSTPFPLRMSVWENYPGHCGSTTVFLKGDDDDNNHNNHHHGNDSTEEKDAYFLLHGGVLAVNGQVLNSSDVLRVDASVSVVSGNQTVSVVSYDASLAKAISLIGGNPFASDEVHTTLDIAASPPRRFGHCAVDIPSSSSLDMLTPEYRKTCELHLSLIIGGAYCDRVPRTLHDVHIRGSVMCEPWLCVTILKNRKESSSLITRSATFSKPSKSPEGVTSSPVHWTTHYPLPGLTPFTVVPRVFATLTPWPIIERNSETVSYAYLGGSVNGWDPLPLFGLWLIHVDTRQWRLSTSLLETFGEEPPSRFGHSAVLVHSQDIYIFGGIGVRRTYLNDLMVLNCSTKVWREVFVPSIFTMPPRAFHSCVLLPKSETLLFMGGEAGGRHESTVWKYNVKRGVWRLVTFPTLDGSLNLLPSKKIDTSTSRFLSAVHLLCERERLDAEGRDATTSIDTQRRNGQGCMHSNSGGNNSSNNNNICALLPTSTSYLGNGFNPVHSPASAGSASFYSSTASSSVKVHHENNTITTTTTVTPLSKYYIAALHGSLLQVLHMRSGVIIFGGTKSPAVTPLSWIAARDYSLKEIAAMWICTHRSRPLYEARLGQPLCPDISTLYEQEDQAKNTTTRERADLVKRSIAEYQLDQWQRYIRKRLRDQ